MGARKREWAGIERDVANVRHELALRVMPHYFKRDLSIPLHN